MSAQERLTPLQLKRQESVSPYTDMVFSTTAERLAYLTSPRRYSGQIVSDIEDSYTYFLSADRSYWLQHGMVDDAVVDGVINRAPSQNAVYDLITYIASLKVAKAGDTMTGNLLMSAPAGVDSILTGGTDVLNLGTSNSDIINIGWSGAIVNIQGSLLYQDVTNLAVKDKLIRLNVTGSAGTGSSSGFEIEEGGIITSYFATNGSRNGWDFKAPTSYQVTLDLSLPTATRTLQAPNNSGIIALISDLTSGYTPLGRTITINGSTQSLFADRTWTITTTGTSNRISVSGGSGLAPTIDIASTYVGQTSITTLGTISTGVWQASQVADSYIYSAPVWHAKQPALNGTGFVKISGTTISYDNSSYYLTSNPAGYITSASIPTVVSAFTNDSGYITASSSNTLTNKSGNISQWTNNSGYITSASIPTVVSAFTNDSGYITSVSTPSLATVLAAGNLGLDFISLIGKGYFLTWGTGDDNPYIGGRLQITDGNASGPPDYTSSKGIAFHMGTGGDLLLQTYSGGAWTTDIRIDNSNGTATFINSIYATAFIESSDITLKSIYIGVEYNTKELQPIAYSWIDTPKDKRIRYGYSAQEVEKYMPGAVFRKEDGKLSVSYKDVFVAKIKNAEDRIKELEEKVIRLEGRRDELGK